MRLFSSLDIGRETLMSHGLAMATVADNISNSSTTGYKSQRPEFSDLLASSVGSIMGPVNETGEGATVGHITTTMTSGTIEATERDLDVAIEGGGFFTITDGTSIYYTRAGNFVTDAEGNLTTVEGEPVMGFTAASPETPAALKISQESSAALPTTATTMTGNLDASAPLSGTIPAQFATFGELNAAAAFKTSVPVIDSLGQQRDIGLFFFRTGVGAWQVRAFADPADIGDGTGTAPVQIGSGELSFDGNGVQTGTGTLSLNATTYNTGGAVSGQMDLSAFTGYAKPSHVASLLGDGRQAGSMVGVRISDEGVVYAMMDNNTEAPIGTLAIARFNNPSGLERLGDNKFGLSEQSGAAVYGSAGEDGRGTIAPKSLEGSNVDLAAAFIDVIKYQRGYQAGSRVIQTADEMIKSTIQIA